VPQVVNESQLVMHCSGNRCVLRRWIIMPQPIRLRSGERATMHRVWATTRARAGWLRRLKRRIGRSATARTWSLV